MAALVSSFNLIHYFTYSQLSFPSNYISSHLQSHSQLYHPASPLLLSSFNKPIILQLSNVCNHVSKFLPSWFKIVGMQYSGAWFKTISSNSIKTTLFPTNSTLGRFVCIACILGGIICLMVLMVEPAMCPSTLWYIVVSLYVQSFCNHNIYFCHLHNRARKEKECMWIDGCHYLRDIWWIYVQYSPFSWNHCQPLFHHYLVNIPCISKIITRSDLPQSAVCKQGEYRVHESD